MVRRPALGATLATSVVFALLLVSSLGIQFAAESGARLGATAEAEHFFWDNSLVAGGTEALRLLAAAQAVLASHPWGCSDPLGQASRELAGLTASVLSGNLSVAAALSPRASSTTPDNLSMLAPFDGSLGGNVDFTLRLRVSGTSNSSTVTYSKQESHPLNLPVRLEAAAALCQESIGQMSSSLNSTALSDCTSEAVGRAVGLASSNPRYEAASSGMAFGVTFAQVAAGSCSIVFEVRIAQLGIRGPGGAFDVDVEESAAANLGS
jgi:hypothetical protein